MGSAVWESQTVPADEADSGHLLNMQVNNLDVGGRHWRTKTINPLEESIGVNLYKHRLGDFFFFFKICHQKHKQKMKR